MRDTEFLKQPNVGDLVKIEWLDVLHKDDLTLSEAKQLKPVPAISYGRLMALDDSRAVVAGTTFPSDEGDEYRDCSAIPRAIVTKICRVRKGA